MIKNRPNQIVIEKPQYRHTSAHPWRWTCNLPSLTPAGGACVVMHSGGTAATWEDARMTALCHAEGAHGVRI